MELLHPEELWRRIPPEEKLDVMAKCHAAGVRAALTMIAVAGTVAVGLKMTPLFWISICASPLVFQFSSSKAWRHSRPKTILEYLAARSAARRFGFAVNSKDLMIQMVFKGTLHEHKSADPESLRYDELKDRTTSVPVWVALLPDAFVMLCEGAEGANNVLSHLINERVSFEGDSPSGGGEYASDRELKIAIKEKRSDKLRHFTLRSHQPAALVVFEKRLKVIHEDYLYKKAKATGQLDSGAGGLPEPEPSKPAKSSSGGSSFNWQDGVIGA